jgi:hypothetical protein
VASMHVDYTAMDWTCAVPFYGPAAVHDGKDIVQLKVLSDRRSEGGRSTKSGQQTQASGGYSLNPKGQPHSAMISSETVALVIYAGEPDEIKSMEIVDIAPGG